MGFGGLFKQENQLTSLSNAASIEAGQAQQQASQTEATALEQQGDIAFQQSQENKYLFLRENQIAQGNTAEQFLSSGVNLAGTPMAQINEIRQLGQIKANAYDQQGKLEQDLMYAKAGITLNEGTQAALQGQIGADINTMQNQIQQTQTKNSFFNGLFGGLLSGGLSILGGLMR